MPWGAVGAVASRGGRASGATRENCACGNWDSASAATQSLAPWLRASVTMRVAALSSTAAVPALARQAWMRSRAVSTACSSRQRCSWACWAAL